MGFRGIIRSIVAGLVLCPIAGWAEDVALIFSESGYNTTSASANEASVSEFRDPLRQAGFRIIEPRTAKAFSMQLAAGQLEKAVANGAVQRLIIIATRPIVNDGRDSWVLSEDGEGASRFSVGSTGISLGALSDLAAQSGAQAVLLTDTAVPRNFRTGAGLKNGPKGIRQDKSVTYVSGPSRGLARALRDSLLNSQMTFAEAAAVAPRNVQYTGFLSDQVGLMTVAGGATSNEDAIEEGFWRAVEALDSVEAMELYIREYPQGTRIKEAQDRIVFLKDEPLRQAQLAEDAINLNRAGRRAIQRNLTLLGFNPRGIDGVFGRGSRAAIAAWQKDNAFPETGYLTSRQVVRLRTQARQEKARQEEEARKKKEQEERRDRAYWRRTGKHGDETGLRNYLARYPNGLFADQANQQLAAIEDIRQQEAAQEERAAYALASDIDTPDSYRGFLSAYPQGAYAKAAQERLDELTFEDQNAAAIARAKSEEKQVAGSFIARQIIEQRLTQVGVDPGAVDGKFTEDTRRAIRQFQETYGLEVTGYVSHQTMVNLVSRR